MDATMYHHLIRFLTLALSILIVSSSIPEDNIVRTDYGDVRGLRDEESGVVKFLNIPYAKSPTGDLRFRRPRRVRNWQGN